jgi:hypothetical protein
MMHRGVELLLPLLLRACPAIDELMSTADGATY